MIAGHGDVLPVSALPVDGTYPERDLAVGKTQHRRRRSRCWDPDDLHPVRQVCPGLPARGDPRQSLRRPPLWTSARRHSSPPARAGRNFPDERSTRSRSRPRTAPAAGCASRPARSRTSSRHRPKAINMAPQPPLRDTERDNWAFFLTLPEVDRTRLNLSRSKTRSSCSRCSSSRAPAPAAAKHRI